MARCLELGKKGAGFVSPNPMVGCVIVNNNEIIGEGYHQKYGKNHAEVNAINMVINKKDLIGATLYVNLEPCSHYGKTPPCCELIVEVGICRVIIGSKDNSKKVNGLGIKYLKENNVNVKVGILQKYCLEFNKRFFTYHEKNRPYIILKWAETKDGFMDIVRNRNKKEINWISSENSKTMVHKWRAHEDAILVGRCTVENDNPKLTVREIEGINPVRIVLDPNLKLDSEFNIFDKSSKTIIANLILEQKKDNIIYLKCNKKDMVLSVLNYLYKIEITSVIVEGGFNTLSSFINNNYWDEARIIIGNKLFENGLKSPVINKQWISKYTIGQDILLKYLND
jgi:diaminohydroxyphosphoribosylaminopyrimidine deaminase/5-amino-6-(5-phosphoribosylamino)uracil reductase